MSGRRSAAGLPAVAVTGGMGAGKSAVARCLCEVSGAVFLDADAVCRDLVATGAPGWLALERAFGKRFFRADQSLDRPLLREVLFADHGVRATVDALLHPLARIRVRERVEDLAASEKGDRIVVEVPLLFEAGWQDEYCRVVVVYAHAAACRRRLAARDGLDARQAAQALQAQMPLENKVLLADHVIDNSGAWSDTCLQVRRLAGLLWPDPAGDFCEKSCGGSK